MGINTTKSTGPAVCLDHTANGTGALSVVVWRRPHDARFLCTLKGIKFSKENE